MSRGTSVRLRVGFGEAAGRGLGFEFDLEVWSSKLGSSWFVFEIVWRLVGVNLAFDLKVVLSCWLVMDVSCARVDYRGAPNFQFRSRRLEAGMGFDLCVDAKKEVVRWCLEQPRFESVSALQNPGRFRGGLVEESGGLGNVSSSSNQDSSSLSSSFDHEDEFVLCPILFLTWKVRFLMGFCRWKFQISSCPDQING
ncbi:hypothetical protein Droror1_Dr00006303 [Drosera rotundifolia]